MCFHLDILVYMYSQKGLHKVNFSFPKSHHEIGERERVESKGCGWSDCLIRNRLHSVCCFILVYPLRHEAPSITSFVLVFSSDGCLCNVPWQQTSIGQCNHMALSRENKDLSILFCSKLLWSLFPWYLEIWEKTLYPW